MSCAQPTPISNDYRDDEAVGRSAPVHASALRTCWPLRSHPEATPSVTMTGSLFAATAMATVTGMMTRAMNLTLGQRQDSATRLDRVASKRSGTIELGTWRCAPSSRGGIPSPERVCRRRVQRDGRRQRDQFDVDVGAARADRVGDVAMCPFESRRNSEPRARLSSPSPT